MTHPLGKFVAVACCAALAACGGPGRGPGHDSGGRGGPPGGPGQGMGQNGQRMVVAAGLLFASFDDNGDYIIQVPEFDAGIGRAFKRADRDGSGALSLFEYQEWSALALGSRTALPAWIGVDVNGDAAITSAEFTEAFAYLAETYGLHSAQGMGLSAFSDDMVGMMSGPGGMGGKGGRPGGGPGGGPPLLDDAS